MISVLCPSRGRPDMLAASVKSLRYLADRPDRLEILVAADHDDPATTDAAFRLNVEALIVGDRLGYSRIWEYYNRLAERATGDWLLLWNDDATMTVAGWDQLIEALPANILVADLANAFSPGLCCFPAVRRTTVDTLGAYSPPTPHVDSWWQEIGRRLGAIQFVDAYVHHDRPDLTGRTPDATYLEGRQHLDHGGFFSPAFQAQIDAAVDTLRTALVTP